MTCWQAKLSRQRGKYSFGVYSITVGKVVTVPANLEPPSKWVAAEQYRLPRGYIEIPQRITAIRGWSYPENHSPLQQPHLDSESA